MAPTRSSLVVCKCETYCTTFNPSTGLYEGEGYLVSRGTRENHSRDGRHLATRVSTTVRSTIPQLVPVNDHRPVQRSSSFIQLWQSEVNILNDLPLSSLHRPLTFRRDPKTSGNYIPGILVSPNSPPFDLELTTATRILISIEIRMHEIQVQLRLLTVSSSNREARERLLDSVKALLDRIDSEKEFHWTMQQNPGDRSYLSTEPFLSRTGPLDPVARAVSLSVLVLENIFFTARRAVRVQLAGLRSVLRLSGTSTTTPVPADPRTCKTFFRLDPVTIPYISCPSCFCLYPFGDHNSDSLPRCIHKSTPESSPCGVVLWTSRNIGGRQTHTVPIRKYLHQDLKTWVGRFLSRPKMEDILDNYKSELLSPQNPSDPISDIWSSTAFRDLVDHRGAPFFSSEGRLVFALAVDSFNPFWNKTAKQSVSSTCIWLVLLNLPPHLRYLPENILLVGVIPGPNKPSTDQINHALRPMIRDLLDFWEPGVFFSRTFRYPKGRHYLGMLIPLIADMLAARQVIGLPGSPTSHYFCTFCDTDISDLDIFEPAAWPPKDPNHLRRIAEQYKSASSEKQQREIFEAYGVRWSVLYDLPYWNPVRCTVIDSMHALDLGLIQNHCRYFLGIDPTKPGGNGVIPTVERPSKRATTKADLKALERCSLDVYDNAEGLYFRLLRYNHKVLYTFCLDHNIRCPGQVLLLGVKHVLAQYISDWRQGTDSPGLTAFCQAHTSISTATTDTVVSEETEEADINEDEPEEESSSSESDGEDELEDDAGRNQSDDEDSSSVGAELDDDDDTTRQLPSREGIHRPKVLTFIKHFLNPSEDAQSKAYKAGTLKIFCYLWDVLDLGDRDPDFKKRVLFEHLQRACLDIEIRLTLQTFLPTSSQRRAILGQEVMQAVWADMKRSQTPTWVDPAPHDWGTTRRGKLSADHWRVIGTVHLPITLIRLWHDIEGPRQAMLRNFMHLISAVRIANMRVMTPNQIQEYQRHILAHVRELQTLFPDVKLRPTHHMACHVYDTLKLFGPVHSHSAPFFERYIHFLQRMKTNRKIGQMESTFMLKAGRYSNLRALLTDDSRTQAEVMEIIETMDSIAKEDARGSRLANMLDPELPSFVPSVSNRSLVLDEEDRASILALVARDDSLFVAHALHPYDAMELSQISLKGVCYAPDHTPHYRNSPIIFRRDPSNPDDLGAGVIQRIFCYSHIHSDASQKQGYYLIVQEHLPIAETPQFKDPYPSFGFAAGYLCEREAQEHYIIALSQVVSHFVLTRFEDTDSWASFIHVLPVDRLMVSFRFEEQDQPSLDAHLHGLDIHDQ